MSTCFMFISLNSGLFLTPQQKEDFVISSFLSSFATLEIIIQTYDTSWQTLCCWDVEKWVHIISAGCSGEEKPVSADLFCFVCSSLEDVSAAVRAERSRSSLTILNIPAAIKLNIILHVSLLCDSLLVPSLCDIVWVLKSGDSSHPSLNQIRVIVW